MWIDWNPIKSRNFDDLFLDMLRLSGLLREIRPQSFTATEIGDATSTVNTIGKFTSKTIWDSTNGRVLYASGEQATDAWNNALGATTITPS